MKKRFWIFLIIGIIGAVNIVSAQSGGGSGTIGLLDKWIASTTPSAIFLRNDKNVGLNNLPNCDTLDTNSQGVIICGTDATGGSSSGVNDWQVLTINAQKYLTPTSTSYNLLLRSTNGLISHGSSTFASTIQVGSGTSTFTGGVYTNDLKTNLPNCNSLDTDASGAIICGVDASGASWNYPFDRNTLYNATSTIIGLTGGFFSSGASSSISDSLHLTGTVNYTTLTAAGDMIYSSDTSGTLSRLAAGTRGKILSMTTGGIPDWIATSTMPFLGSTAAAGGDLTGNYPNPTVAANSVALTTDTTGNYAAGDAEAGNALTGDSATSFFSSGTLEPTIGGTGLTTYAVGDTLYGSATNVLSKLTAGTRGKILSITTGGIPGWIATSTFYTVGGTDVAIADGGTGQSTAILGFNALSPLTTAGDVLTHNGTNNIRLGAGTRGQLLGITTGGALGYFSSSSLAWKNDSATSTFVGGIYANDLKTNLPNCDSLDTDASGALICGTDSSGGAVVPNLIYQPWGLTKYYTASTSASNNLAFRFNNGFVSHASSTVVDLLQLSSGLNSTAISTSTFSGGISVANLETANNIFGSSGGLTITGGTASGDDLSLISTTNATKGSIFFGTSGGTQYDEVKDKLLIGTGNDGTETKLGAVGTITVTSGTNNFANFVATANPASTAGSIYRGLNFSLLTTNDSLIGYSNTFDGVLGLVQHRADSNIANTVHGGNFSVITGPTSGLQDDGALIQNAIGGTFLAKSQSHAIGAQIGWYGGEFISQVKNNTVTTNVIGGLFGVGLSTDTVTSGLVATITIASPAVVTINAHKLVCGRNIQFTTTGALPTGITAAIDYYVKTTGLTANTFQISTTSGCAGAAVNTSGSQSGVHTVNAMDSKVTNMEAARFGQSGVSGVLTGSLGTITNPTMVRIKPWLGGPTYTNVAEELTIEDTTLGIMAIRQQGLGDYNYFAGKTLIGADATQSAGSLTNAPTGQLEILANADGTTPYLNLSSASGLADVLTVTNSKLIGVNTSTPWGQFSIDQLTSQTKLKPIFLVGDTGTTTPFFAVNQKGQSIFGTTTLAFSNAGATSTRGAIFTPTLTVDNGHSGTTTVMLGDVGNKVCLKIRDVDNGAWSYCRVKSGVFTCSSVSCE